MQSDEWFNLIKRYREAVTAFSEAVGGLDSISDASFRRSWECAEKARKEVESARDAFLNYELSRSPARAASAEHTPVALYPTEDLVLGDQGQSGG
jgi:hypothetical protein